MQDTDTTADSLPQRPSGVRGIVAWLAALWPEPMRVDGREKLRAVVGAAAGLVFTALVCRWIAGGQAAVPWLIAPLGASAVLVFGVPASPLAQPWSVVGGNTVSAIVGAACAVLIGDPLWAGAVAVAGAIGAMFALRCLHPPGGATALLTVLVQAGWSFALFPVMTSSLLLVVAGLAYNRATGRRYPHLPRQRTERTGSRFTAADLDAALAHYDGVLDVTRADLEDLLHHAELAAYRRNLGELRCADIMTPGPVHAEFGTPLDEAWTVMRRRRIKALPVIDRARRIIGIVTVADFMREARLDEPHGLGGRLRAFVRRSGLTHTTRPEVVGQIMTRQVRVASMHRHVIELIPLFSEGGHHHIPIIDAEQRLAGIITQTDLVRALYRAVRPQD